MFYLGFQQYSMTGSRGVARIQIDPLKILRKILTMIPGLWRWRHYRETDGIKEKHEKLLRYLVKHATCR